ncbi:MAG: LptF/LptG family permease [Planctomycetota bacterium]
MTLERYIFGILLKNFVLLVLVVTGLVFLVGMVQSLGRYDDLNLLQILERLPFVLPYALTFAMPLGILIASLFTFGRLSADNEITAIRMGGVHPLRILMPAFSLGLAVSIVVLVLNSWLTPAGLARARSITKDDLRRFLDSLEASSRVEFESEKVKMRWTGVDNQGWMVRPRFTLETDSGLVKGEADRIRVRREVDDAGDLLNLHFEFRDVAFERDNFVLRQKYSEQSFPVEDLFEGSRKATRKETLTSADLRFHTIRDPRLGRPEKTKYLLQYRTEYSTRVALALASFLFVLIGAPVGMLGRRASFVGAGIVALLIAFVLYFPLHEVGKNLAMSRVLPPEWAMAIPGTVVGLIGLVLTIRVVRQ